MGAKTMFDLNQSLHDWQERLRQGEGCSQDNIDELEEHLREEMAGLAQVGLSSEEAFLLATRRLGGVDILKEEFAKVNTSFVWLNRLRWMAIGVLIYLGASTATTFVRVLELGAATAGLNSYVVGVLSPVARVGVMTLIAILAIKVVSRRTMDSRNTLPLASTTKRRLFLAVLLWFTVLPVGALIVQAWAYRHVSPEDMQRTAIATGIGQFALSVVLPLAIAGWLLKTWRSSNAPTTETL
jgi:hypothetical protein